MLANEDLMAAKVSFFLHTELTFACQVVMNLSVVYSDVGAEMLLGELG